MNKITEREIIIYILLDITKEGAYNNIILRKNLQKYNYLSKIEKSFITEVVNGVLRNLINIDYIINNFSKVKTTKMKDFILNNLRSSIYQIKFMNKVPNFAICNEAVKLTNKKGLKNLSSFVNGILRNIIRNIDNIKYPSKEKDYLNYISIVYSHPLWLIKYWNKNINIKTIEEICKKNIEPPKVTICTNTLKISRDNLINKLTEEKVQAEIGKYNKNAVYITKTSNIRDLISFKEGLFHIMDESSMFVPNILNLKKNDIVYDVCGAPGGKSFYLSYLMEDKVNIETYDIHEYKIELILQSIERLGIKNIKIKKIDATKIDESKKFSADCVIVDAPCTGFGLIRKKPDIKYTKKEEDIDNLVNLQRKILSVSQNYVKIGGSLVYSTCTISHKENIENVKWFLNNYNYELEDISKYAKNYENIDTAKLGYVQFLPNTHEIDGFFVAKMIRKG